MLFACSKCFSRHPFEELSPGQQLCKVIFGGTQSQIMADGWRIEDREKMLLQNLRHFAGCGQTLDRDIFESATTECLKTVIVMSKMSGKRVKMAGIQCRGNIFGDTMDTLRKTTPQIIGFQMTLLE